MSQDEGLRRDHLRAGDQMMGQANPRVQSMPPPVLKAGLTVWRPSEVLEPADAEAATAATAPSEMANIANFRIAVPNLIAVRPR